MVADDVQGTLCIIGAGIVGLALARELQARHPGAHLTVLDKEPQVGAHQTGHNSGVVHAGVYYQPGSLKARLCTQGRPLLKRFCEEHGLAYDECGKVIVATEEHELAALEELHRRGRANGVPGLELIGPDRLHELEPHAAGIAALHSPRTAIVDFAEVARAMAASLSERGVSVLTGCEVRGITQAQDRVVLRTSAGELAFDHVVVCAGLGADRLARQAGDRRDPQIVPFRGEYWMLVPERRHLVNGLIYPVPDPSLPFLGVHLTRRVDGEVLIGPNAVLALAREGYRWRDVAARDVWETLRWVGFRRLARRYWRVGAAELHRSLHRARFARDAAAYVPELNPGDLVPAAAGVRAQAVARDGALLDDFSFTQVGRVSSLRNAPSPAATSSLAIAAMVADAVEQRLR
ncbi:MAG: L-2-hydroxyglutarate oxidase [Nitriliruptoraceae bacterium]